MKKVHDYDKHIISEHITIKEALKVLNELGTELTLFVIDENKKLIGTVTDGDIRRALLQDVDINSNIGNCMFREFRFIDEDNFTIGQFKSLREKKIKIVPVLNDKREIKNIINIDKQKSILPLEAILMAGGVGMRLRPLTETTPKPMIKIGGVPIIERNIDRLAEFGVNTFHISVNYLKEKIIGYFNNGESKELDIKYIHEDTPLGTIGSVRSTDDYQMDTILVMNSDLLTNIDFEAMYNKMIAENADIIIASIPYNVDIPYAVLNVNDIQINSFEEKPKYTYYSNAGIYMMKKGVINIIPKDTFYNATDLIEELINNGKRVIHFPILGYWSDIGKPDDLMKAEKDFDRIKF